MQYGGGRTLRPGEVLETEEDKAAIVKQTRQLLAAYKKKIGLNIDPKLRAECEKTLKNGDSLMDSGNLKEALPYYEEVMSKLPFKIWHMSDLIYRPEEEVVQELEKSKAHGTKS